MYPKAILYLLLSVLTIQGYTQTDTVAADSQFIKCGGFHSFWFGKNYRSIWATPVAVSEFHLQHNGHHFTPVKTGGGLQTVSLHITDETGNEWVLRSVQKNPANWVSPFWRKTFVKDIVQDQISGSFPYGALIVPVIANALSIDHNNPQLVLVHDDTALGKFREAFANRLCFLEERNPKGKTISTEKLLQLKDSLATVKIDSSTYLKCRLMDIVIGDWDRHADQYRWYSKKQHDTILYIPIPNDRDQVFFHSGGLIPKAIIGMGFMRYMEGFNETVHHINGFMQRGLSLDKKILHNFSLEEWMAITNEVASKLTDQVLHDAYSRLPAEIKTGNPILLKKMVVRRMQLKTVSEQYFYTVTK